MPAQLSRAALNPSSNLSDLVSTLSALLNLHAEGRTTVADTAYTILFSDKVVSLTSITASRIFTLPAASAVNPGHEILITDASGSLSQTLTLSIARAGTDTIEGGTTSWTIRTPNGFRRIISDGVSNWILVAMSVDMQFWTGASTNTLAKEPGARSWDCELVGGGCGGGGGGQQASGVASAGGGGGGGGGFTYRKGLTADLPGTVSVVIGAGGVGGAGAASPSTAGTAGTNGASTTFAAGTAAVQALAQGGLTTGGGQGTGSGGAGGGGGNGAVGNNASTSFGAGAGGGGGGGGVNTGGVFQIGAHGASGGVFGSNYGQVGASGNARATTDGGAGGSPSNITPAGYPIPGPGAGGGAGSAAGNGGAGGAGARPGGGGGGGGAATNTHTGGAGGVGGDGAALVRQWI